MIKWAIRRRFNCGQMLPSTHPDTLRPGELLPGMGAEEFAQRRRRLFDLIDDKSVSVVLRAAPVKYMSQNIFYRYQQDNNLLYLTGWNEPDTVAAVERDRFLLFFDEQSPHDMQWQGNRNSVLEAKELFKADYVYPLHDLEDYLQSCRVCPDTELLVQRLRVQKSASEVELMRRSARIASRAILDVQEALTGNMREESQIEARFEYACRRDGAQGLAYVPVVAGDERGCTIHYTRNDQLVKRSLLLDAGCRYFGYCSDVTRTFNLANDPSHQRIIDVVGAVQSACLDVLRRYRPSLNQLHDFANQQVSRHLQALLDVQVGESLVQRLFPHAIGHYLGMDVHDCPLVGCDDPMRPGMVITVEPGLYFPPDFGPFAGLACRIEDDVLITSDGVEILSSPQQSVH